MSIKKGKKQVYKVVTHKNGCMDLGRHSVPIECYVEKPPLKPKKSIKKMERKEKDEELTLKPEDYIVFAGGLKISNVGESLITFALPNKYTVSPLIVTESINPSSN